jgi:hypothetical protein
MNRAGLALAVLAQSGLLQLEEGDEISIPKKESPPASELAEAVGVRGANRAERRRLLRSRKSNPL